MSLRSFDRPGQVPKDRVFENFRNPGWRKNRKSAQVRREGNDPKHLTAIRKLSCSVCPETRHIDPHHLKHAAAAQQRSFGRRATDEFAVPLCRYHHDEVERLGSRREHEFWNERLVDAHALAARLWRDSANVGRMEATLQEFKRTAIRKQSEVLRLVRQGLTLREADEQIAAGLPPPR